MLNDYTLTERRQQRHSMDWAFSSSRLFSEERLRRDVLDTIPYYILNQLRLHGYYPELMSIPQLMAAMRMAEADCNVFDDELGCDYWDQLVLSLLEHDTVHGERAEAPPLHPDFQETLEMEREPDRDADPEHILSA